MAGPFHPLQNYNQIIKQKVKKLKIHSMFNETINLRTEENRGETELGKLYQNTDIMEQKLQRKSMMRRPSQYLPDGFWK